jgi:hypothetical protein
MPESVLTEPINVEKEAAKVAPVPPAKRSSKAFNSFQIAQAPLPPDYSCSSPGIRRRPGMPGLPQ